MVLSIRVCLLIFLQFHDPALQSAIEEKHECLQCSQEKIIF